MTLPKLQHILKQQVLTLIFFSSTAAYCQDLNIKAVMGGGVMSNLNLFPLVTTKVQALLNGYVAVSQIERDIDDFIVPPALGDDAGFLGAVAMTISRQT